MLCKLTQFTYAKPYVSKICWFAHTIYLDLTNAKLEPITYLEEYYIPSNFSYWQTDWVKGKKYITEKIGSKITLLNKKIIYVKESPEQILMMQAQKEKTYILEVK